MTRPQLYPRHQHQWTYRVPAGFPTTPATVVCTVCGFEVPRNLAKLDGTITEPTTTVHPDPSEPLVLGGNLAAWVAEPDPEPEQETPVTAAQPDYAATVRQFPDDTWTEQTRKEWIEVVAKGELKCEWPQAHWLGVSEDVRTSYRERAAIVVDALLAHLAAQQPRPTHGGGHP
jgi:hypothetical protein